MKSDSNKAFKFYHDALLSAEANQEWNAYHILWLMFQKVSA